MTLKGKLTIDSVLLEKQAIEELHDKSYYGRIKGDTLEISLPESGFLIYMGKIRVEFEGKKLVLKTSSLWHHPY